MRNIQKMVQPITPAKIGVCTGAFSVVSLVPPLLNEEFFLILKELFPRGTSIDAMIGVTMWLAFASGYTLGSAMTAIFQGLLPKMFTPGHRLNNSSFDAFNIATTSSYAQSAYNAISGLWSRIPNIMPSFEPDQMLAPGKKSN